MRCFRSSASRFDRICPWGPRSGSGLSPLFLASLVIAGTAISGAAKTHDGRSHGSRIGPRVTSQLTGSVSTHDGGHLHLVTKLGNVVIQTRNSGKVDYSVQLEADASQRNAKALLKDFRVYAREAADGVYIKGITDGGECSGRLWITINVNVPKNYSLDVSTGGGNIEAEDIDGRVTLVTSGGNVSAGNVGTSARLESESGGHISVKNVSGDLTAITGGGHITTGSIAGNANLRTTGGHIRVASVEGVAHLETGGGNVTLQHSGSELFAETTGGQIEVGEAAGLVRAKTGGGGIRVVRVSGPTDLQTAGGSIYLTQVDGAVKASASAGGITAWFVSHPKGRGSCELESNDGDIVVYLPRQLPATIDAKIQMGDDHRVFVDPAFPLKVSYDDSSNGVRMVRAEGALNGGGEVIRLRTVAGNIRLAVSDSNKQLQLYKMQMDQLQRKLESQMRLLEQMVPTGDEQPRP